MKNKIIISIGILGLIFLVFFVLRKSNISEKKIVAKQVQIWNDKINEIENVKSGKIDLTNNIYLKWSIKDFIEKDHKIEYCKSTDARYICKIDNKEWFGSDFKMDLPKNELEKLSIYINNKPIKLDESQIYNPNNSGELNQNQFKFEKQANIYILYAYFSDGAGTYTTKWKIKGNKSERGKLSNDELDFEWQKN